MWDCIRVRNPTNCFVCPTPPPKPIISLAVYLHLWKSHHADVRVNSRRSKKAKKSHAGESGHQSFLHRKNTPRVGPKKHPLSNHLKIVTRQTQLAKKKNLPCASKATLLSILTRKLSYSKEKIIINDLQPVNIQSIHRRWQASVTHRTHLIGAHFTVLQARVHREP